MVLLFRKLILLLFLIRLFLPADTIQADTGPKPSMDFDFTQELDGNAITVLAGTLYECEQPDCNDAVPLEEVGPQGFYCESNHCYAIAYGFAPYHQIEIEFSDGIRRRSNTFETAGFDSEYVVTVHPQDLLVKANDSLALPPLATMLILLFACLLAGGVGLIGLILFVIRRSSRK